MRIVEKIWKFGKKIRNKFEIWKKKDLDIIWKFGNLEKDLDIKNIGKKFEILKKKLEKIGNLGIIWKFEKNFEIWKKWDTLKKNWKLGKSFEIFEKMKV